VLTKGLGRVGTRRRVVGVELLRRRWDGVQAWPMEGSSGRPGSTDRVLGVLRSRTEGQGGPVLYDGEQLLKKPCTCGGDSRGESRRGRGGDRGQRAW